MTDLSLHRIQEEAKRARIAAGNAALKEKLRARQGAKPVSSVEQNLNCIVCGKPNPKGMARVCSGECYIKAPL